MTEFGTVTAGAAVGKFFYLDLEKDLTGTTDHKITFTKADGSILDVVPTIGTVDITDPDDPTIILALADQYLEYQWVSGNVDKEDFGQWKAYVELQKSGVTFFGNNSGCFLVLNPNFCNT